MSDNNKNDPDELTTIESLQDKIDHLDEQLSRLAKIFIRCDEINDTFRRLSEKDIAYAFERIEKIEHLLFPHLQGDINRLSDIIGEGDNKGFNPADFRDPKKK